MSASAQRSTRHLAVAPHVGCQERLAIDARIAGIRTPVSGVLATNGAPHLKARFEMDGAEQLLHVLSFLVVDNANVAATGHTVNMRFKLF